jgi:hypothetical protein
MEKQGPDDAEQLLSQLTAFTIDMSFFRQIPVLGVEEKPKFLYFTGPCF